MSKKDDHESWVLTQNCIAYMLISTYSLYAKFDVNVFNNITTNVAIFTVLGRYCLHMSRTINMYSIIQLPFAIFRYTWKIKKSPFR